MSPSGLQIDLNQQGWETELADIGEALADADLVQVYNDSGSSWVTSALSRLKTYLKYSDVITTTLGDTVAASSTEYAAPYYFPTLGSAFNVAWPKGGTLKNLYVRQGGTSQPASGSMVITLYVNGVATALTVTIAAGTGGPATHSDTTHTVALSAGDLIMWVLVNNATATSCSIGNIAMELEQNVA